MCVYVCICVCVHKCVRVYVCGGGGGANTLYTNYVDRQQFLATH